MSDLVIFGTGGYGREVAQVAEDVGEWNLLGFLDGDETRHGSELRGLPVLGGADWAAAHRDVAVAVAVGVPVSRRKVVAELDGATFATLVHPRAWIGSGVALGEGSIVLAGAMISTDIEIGPFACLNKNCVLGHDVHLESFVTIAPTVSLSGQVHIGEACDIGAGAVVLQGRTVGEGTIVGAGAVVAHDLPAFATAVGVPARVIKQRAG